MPLTLHSSDAEFGASWLSSNGMWRVDAKIIGTSGPLVGDRFDFGLVSILRAGAEVFRDESLTSGAQGFGDARDMLACFASFVRADDEGHSYNSPDCIFENDEATDEEKAALHEFMEVWAEEFAADADHYTQVRDDALITSYPWLISGRDARDAQARIDMSKIAQV